MRNYLFLLLCVHMCVCRDVCMVQVPEKDGGAGSL